MQRVETTTSHPRHIKDQNIINWEMINDNNTITDHSTSSWNIVKSKRLNNKIHKANQSHNRKAARSSIIDPVNKSFSSAVSEQHTLSTKNSQSTIFSDHQSASRSIYQFRKYQKAFIKNMNQIIKYLSLEEYDDSNFTLHCSEISQQLFQYSMKISSLETDKYPPALVGSTTMVDSTTMQFSQYLSSLDFSTLSTTTSNSCQVDDAQDFSRQSCDDTDGNVPIWIPLEVNALANDCLFYTSNNVVSNEEAYKLKYRRKSCEGIMSKPIDQNFIKRGFSPPIPKRIENIDLDLKQRQLKAGEKRESILNEKSEKLKLKAEDKAHALVERRIKEKVHLETLQKSIQEKQIKAEKLRDSRLRGIQNKVRSELGAASFSEVASKAHTLQSIENATYQSSSARRILALSSQYDLDLYDKALKPREAAPERKKLQEQERLLKIKLEADKKHKQAKERLERELVKKHERLKERDEKNKRWEIFQMQDEQAKADMQRRIQEKSDLVTKRHEETLELVKEKAANANQQAKQVADRINEIRKTPERRLREDDILLVGQVNAFDGFKFLHAPNRSKPVKKRLKKIRETLFDITKEAGLLGSLIAKPSKLIDCISLDIIRVIDNTVVKLTPFKCGVLWKPLDASGYSNRLQQSKKLDASLDILIKHLQNNVLSLEPCNFDLLEVLVKVSVAIDNNNTTLYCPRILSKTVNTLQQITRASITYQRILLLETFSDLLEVSQVEVPSLIIELVEFADRLLYGCELSEQYQLEMICNILEILCMVISLDDHDKSIIKAKSELVRYILSVNIIESVSKLLMVVDGHLSSCTTLLFLEVSIKLLSLLTLHCSNSRSEAKNDFDLYPLAAHVIKSTDIVAAIVIGAVSLSAGQGDANKVDANRHLIQISINALQSLNNAAMIDCTSVQNTLGSDGIQTAFFHIVSFWLKFWINSGVNPMLASLAENILLSELLLLLGYAVIEHQGNRAMLRFGSAPSILLMLVRKLPLDFFIQPRLKMTLFPTLIAACHLDEDNRLIMQEDISIKLLTGFAKDVIQSGGGLGRPFACFPPSLLDRAVQDLSLI